MKTIDEKELDKRANECYYEMSDVADVNCADVKEAYKRGATEQDPIAYLRGRNDALKEMAEVIEQKEREVIEKAWQFIEVIIIREGLASEDFVKEMNWRFKKAMEE